MLILKKHFQFLFVSQLTCHFYLQENARFKRYCNVQDWCLGKIFSSDPNYTHPVHINDFVTW